MKRFGIERLSRRQFVKTAAAAATVAFPHAQRGAADD